MSISGLFFVVVVAVVALFCLLIATLVLSCSDFKIQFNVKFGYIFTDVTIFIHTTQCSVLCQKYKFIWE